jgi:hypothetical protein
MGLGGGGGGDRSSDGGDRDGDVVVPWNASSFGALS